jgi:type II secretory pathway predicted ATPase ExeA/protein involved in polysaccharide export with SLBB domain
VHVLKFNDSGATESSKDETPAAMLPIYSSFYGLRERPFTLTPDPRFLYLSGRQREALSSLKYGLTTAHGFMLMTGEAGCGKTTMLRAALSGLEGSKTKCVLVNNPTLSRADFYELLARAFGFSEEAASSKARFLEELQRLLEERVERGVSTGLVIDEAQSMPSELLEEVRLLGNIESTSAKLLNIVLAGQPELLERLRDPLLDALKQRIALRCELKRFDSAETAAYIAGRLRIAGGLPQDIFTRESVLMIHDATGGLPRTVNVLCENALISGFAEQVRPVPMRIVKEVAHEFEMTEVPAMGGGDASDAPGGPPAAESPAPESDRGGLFRDVSRPKKRFSFFGALLLAAVMGASPVFAQAPAPAAASAAQSASEPPADYVIGPEDVLGVVFWRDADMTGDVTVRPDGMITLPLIGDLRAVGLQPAALREAITKAAGRFLEDINVTVVVRKINSRKAFITGEVRAPGAYDLAGPRTVLQLIALAGGLTEYADGKNITVMRNEQGQMRTLKFNYKDVSRGKNLSQNVEVKPGDTVVVP